MDQTLISVDRWSGGSQAYFLTHLHSDHTSGLSSSWSHAPLFCSPITAKLLPYKFLDFDLSLLRIVEIGTWHEINLVSPSSGAPTVVHVIAIDACHCPGAVMLLFRGEFGCMLYTGDFRWEPSCERAKKAKEMLVDAVNGDVVDVVYLDNTYCNPTYDFPTRQVAAQQVIDLIRSYPDHDVIIGINTLGKEDLLVQIAREVEIMIWVWPERLRTMHLLGFEDIFTTNTTLTRVRAVPQYSFSIDTLEALNQIIRPTIGIMPSGLPWVKKPHQNCELISDSSLTSHQKRAKLSADDEVQKDNPIGNIRPPQKIHDYIYTVPYSDHSNFSEIENLIKLVQPANLKGIVSSSSCYIEPMYHFGRLCQANQRIQGLHNKLKGKESGTGVIGAVSNIKSVRGKISKTKFSRVRASRVSILRKNFRGAKILERDSSDPDSSDQE